MTNKSFLNTKDKKHCTGCQACIDVCPVSALHMEYDEEGFAYPVIDDSKCVHCNLCNKVCQENETIEYGKVIECYGGYTLDEDIRKRSSSGGIFSLIANYCIDNGYIVFGAVSDGLDVVHREAHTKEGVTALCKSKYKQSNINGAYKRIKQLLSENHKVLFSGTPCQVEGLKLYLDVLGITSDNLLTIEVICEGVPSPIYLEKYKDYLEKKYHSKLIDYIYRSKTNRNQKICKWDFQVQKAVLKSQKDKTIELYRWFNPFYSIWLTGLMSRPSCYQCKYTKVDRVADVTLGDLWGVHIFAPELYGKNNGVSSILLNSKKAVNVFSSVKKDFYGHLLDVEIVKKYQSRLRDNIPLNGDRNSFMEDLKSPITYKTLIKKWWGGSSFSLLWKKYVYGNRQKMFIWRIKNRLHN